MLVSRQIKNTFAGRCTILKRKSARIKKKAVSLVERVYWNETLNTHARGVEIKRSFSQLL